MVQRPTITLACILKNESHNIGPLLSSVKGCFDEIVFVDTGSTDNSVFFIEQVNKQIEAGSQVWAGIPEIKLYHFDWINDFAAARNFSFDKATSDYIMWLDLDDQLSDAKAFIRWRDTVLHSAHYWMAVYNYAFNPEGHVECKFIRERVVRNRFGFKWEYPVHEGLLQKEGRKFWPQKANTWWVNHKRTEEDRKNDHLRNVKIMEQLKDEKLSPRMKFYYGKELFENGFHKEAGKPLLEAAGDPNLEIHDRLLTIQYAAQSAFKCEAYGQALDLLYNGLKLKPSRAEYWCGIGDVFMVTGKFSDAIHAYRAAETCSPDDMGGVTVLHEGAYSEYPKYQMAQIYLNMGDAVNAEKYIDSLHEMKSPRATELEVMLQRVKELSEVRTDLPKTDDVIITCPAGSMGDWDEVTLKEKGHGGSETAAIEVAKWIRLKTNRRVKIFQTRKARSVMDSGVEYLPNSELHGYLKNVEPAAHIAWRHPVKLTKAKSYIWCHDLQMPGAERSECDKVVALSEFHKNYLIETNGVPEDKIVLGFNGINPDDFSFDEEVARDPLKVVFSSSPDRGLVQSIDIVKAAREISGGMDIKLHCFYGTDNMRKMGLTQWAESIEQKIKDNSDFVVYHGMVNKKTLMRHFRESAVWLYPADFIETSCLTAMEAVYAGVWPIVRPMGALPYTLSEAIEKECCDVINTEVIDEASVGIWANRLVDAIIEKKYTRVKGLNVNTWEKVSDFFIKELSL